MNFFFALFTAHGLDCVVRRIWRMLRTVLRLGQRRKNRTVTTLVLVLFLFFPTLFPPCRSSLSPILHRNGLARLISCSKRFVCCVDTGHFLVYSHQFINELEGWGGTHLIGTAFLWMCLHVELHRMHITFARGVWSEALYFIFFCKKTSLALLYSVRNSCSALPRHWTKQTSRSSMGSEWLWK